jgi:hypothetical protein
MTRNPKDGALIALFMNELPPRKRRSLRHLAACSRCTVRFNVLRQVKRDLQPQVDSFAGAFGADEGASLLRVAAGQKIRSLDPRHPGTRSTTLLRPFGMLSGLRFAVGFVAVLAVVTTGAYLTLARLRKHSELRSPSLKITLLEPVGTVSSAPGTFRWTPVTNAEDYYLELIDDTLVRVHAGSIFLITEATLPAAARSKLVKGRPYVWSISAYDADGNLVTTKSGSFTIE